jgi:predicted ATPase
MKIYTKLLILPWILLFFSFVPCHNRCQILEYITPSQPTKQSHRYVITGGPGVGKTSIIHHLKEMGYHVVGEAATDVIRHSLAQGITRPWDKEYKSDFNDEILDLQQHRQNEIPDTGLVFFDRSMIDSFTYALIPMGGTESLETMVSKVQSVIDKQFYNQIVFFIDNLNGCETTEIRHENLDQLQLIERHLEQNYRALGYNVIHIGRDTVENRAKQIVSSIESLQRNE